MYNYPKKLYAPIGGIGVGSLGVSHVASSQAAAAVGGFPNVNSMAFDGTNDYIDMGDADVFTPNSSGADRGFTMSYWINPAATGNLSIGSKRIFAGGAQRWEWRTMLNYQSKPLATFYGNDNQNILQQLLLDTALSVGTWYHVAFTFDLADANTSIVGYVNGVKATNGSGGTYSSAGTWSAVSNTAAAMHWGRIHLAYGQCSLDEVSMFDDALTEAQVQAIYNSGTPTDLSGESHLLGWWRMGDGDSHPTITDQSSNGNDGTMTNMDSADITTSVP